MLEPILDVEKNSKIEGKKHLYIHTKSGYNS